MTEVESPQSKPSPFNGGVDLTPYSFKPGQSGNPAGRKPYRSLADELKDRLRENPHLRGEIIDVLIDLARDATKPAYALLAQKMLWERHDGPLERALALRVDLPDILVNVTGLERAPGVRAARETMREARALVKTVEVSGALAPPRATRGAPPSGAEERGRGQAPRGDGELRVEV